MQSPLCAYCGIKPGITRDHVVPKCLFTEPLPEFMVTVPACELCHGPAKSADDQYLRDLLVLSYGSQNHPVAQAHALGATWRAAEKNRSKVANSLKEKGKLVSLYDEGLLVGQIGVIPVDEARVRRIFATMLRGLHYKVTEKILPTDAHFELLGIPPKDYPRQLTSWQQKECVGPAILGYEGLVIFRGYYFLFPDPYHAAWLISFYEGVHYFLCAHQATDKGFGMPHQPKPFDKIDHWEM